MVTLSETVPPTLGSCRAWGGGPCRGLREQTRTVGVGLVFLGVGHLACCRRVVVVVGVFWWFVESCIVDASILFVLVCVVKCVRAVGGCLGTRGR